MNQYCFRLFLFLTVSIVLLTSVTAQKKAAKKVKSPKNFEVHLPVAVTDKKRNFVTNLTGKDFVVLENNRRQEIKLFSGEKNNPPVYVGVLMDTSPSTKGKLVFSKEAAMNFIYTVIKERKNKAAFMTFDHKMILRQDFTDKTDLLQRAIGKVKESGRQTSLYDAIWNFSDEKLRNASGRRAIVVISDSKDNFSRAKIEDAIDIAQRTETVIYVISTAETSPDKEPDKALLQVTTETGGATYFANDMLALERALSKITKEFETQYTITYRPKNQKYDRKDRIIEVRLKGENNKDYKVRTRTKYRLVEPL